MSSISENIFILYITLCEKYFHSRLGTEVAPPGQYIWAGLFGLGQLLKAYIWQSQLQIPIFHFDHEQST